jgi:hypothetical protein
VEKVQKLSNSFLEIITPWPESASELYRPSDRSTSEKLVPTLADRGCHVVSVTDPHGRILGFINRSRYIFFQVVPQLYSRGSVDPVPDQLLLRKSGSAGNGTRISGSVARNSDHLTTQAVIFSKTQVNLYYTTRVTPQNVALFTDNFKSSA